MRKLTAVFAVLWLTIAFAAYGQETYTLKRLFKEGTERRYASKAVIVPAKGQEYRLVVDREDAEKCLKITPEGNAQLESREIKVTIKFNDMEIPNSTEESGSDKTIVSPRNEILNFESSGSDDETGIRLARALQVVYPEKPIPVGHSWTSETKADEKARLRGGSTNTKFLAVETVKGIPCAKLEHKYTEKPFSSDKGKVRAELTVWVDLSNGELVKMSAKVTGLVIDLGGEDTEISLDATSEYLPAK